MRWAITLSNLQKSRYEFWRLLLSVRTFIWLNKPNIFFFFPPFISEDGKLYTFGENEFGKLGLGEADASSSTPQHVTSIEEPVRCVSCGNNHTAAITGESLD